MQQPPVRECAQLLVPNMGGSVSNLRRNLQGEFNRLCPVKKQALVLNQLLQLRVNNISCSPWLVDTQHLGVLFNLDSDRDGQFSLPELESFLELATRQSNKHPPHEFQSQLQGHCTYRLWKAIAQEDGQEVFVDWFCKLLLRTCTTPDTKPKKIQGHTYVNRETVYILFQLLSIQATQGVDFQTFFDLLQRAGEEMGLMDLDNEELDEWLVLDVVRQFLYSLREGLLQVVEQLFVTSDLYC